MIVIKRVKLKEKEKRKKKRKKHGKSHQSFFVAARYLPALVY